MLWCEAAGFVSKPTRCTHLKIHLLTSAGRSLFSCSSFPSPLAHPPSSSLSLFLSLCPFPSSLSLPSFSFLFCLSPRSGHRHLGERSYSQACPDLNWALYRHLEEKKRRGCFNEYKKIFRKQLFCIFFHFHKHVRFNSIKPKNLNQPDMKEYSVRELTKDRGG